MEASMGIQRSANATSLHIGRPGRRLQVWATSYARAAAASGRTEAYLFEQGLYISITLRGYQFSGGLSWNRGKPFKQIWTRNIRWADYNGFRNES
jgi:hypothetical protein